MKILITRPIDQSIAFATKIKELGYLPVIEPLINISFTRQANICLDRINAVLITSGNGVRALAKAVSERNISLFVVGEITANIARSYGFNNILMANFNARSLLQIVQNELPDKTTTKLIHVSASEVKFDLVKVLAQLGYDIKQVILYDRVLSKSLTKATKNQIANEQIDSAVFFSQSAAKNFVRLINKLNLTEQAKKIKYFCTAKDIGLELKSLSITELLVSNKPTSFSMIEAIRNYYL